jgi:UDP-N-acetylmuramate--alanine ligase
MRALPLTIGTIHFVGIGGIGMSGIAEVLHNLGYTVQGSRHRRQRQRQAPARGRHSGRRSATRRRIVGGAQVVVVSTAVKRRQPRGRRRAREVASRWCAAPKCWPS